MSFRQQGFTLLEILIALAVFAVLAGISSSAMYYAFNTRARVTEQAERLNQLQLTITLLQRDIEQSINRPVRGNEMHISPAFVGEPQYLELTRTGHINPFSQEKRSSLRRIALLCQGPQLIKRSWESLDTANRKNYEDRVLLNNLESCQFAYLNQNLEILTSWQPNAVAQNQRPEPLPKAIRLSLNLKDWHKMSYLFTIPAALYGEK